MTNATATKVDEKALETAADAIYGLGGFEGRWITIGQKETARNVALQVVTAYLSALPVSDTAGMREALEWYAHQAGNCRKLHSEGDVARKALNDDCGKRARDALAVLAPSSGETDTGWIERTATLAHLDKLLHFVKQRAAGRGHLAKNDADLMIEPLLDAMIALSSPSPQKAPEGFVLVPKAALDLALGEIAEAADKFWVIHLNHPGDPPNKEMLTRRQDEDKAFLAKMADRMNAAHRTISAMLASAPALAPSVGTKLTERQLKWLAGALSAVHIAKAMPAVAAEYDFDYADECLISLWTELNPDAPKPVAPSSGETDTGWIEWDYDNVPRDGTWLELKTPLQTVIAQWGLGSLSEDDDEGWIDTSGFWVLEEGEQPSAYRPVPPPSLERPKPDGEGT